MHSFKRIMSELDVLQQNYSYSGSDIEYIGYANPGVSEGSENWMIIKYFYDANSNVVKKRFADGRNDFTKKWSLRTTYNYGD